MRVMILSTLYPPYNIGGAEKSVELIARGLSQLGHDVSIVTLQNGGKTRQEVVQGVRIHYTPLRNIYWPYGGHGEPNAASKLIFHVIDTLNVAMAHAVESIVRAIQPDIVLSNGMTGFSALAWRPIHRAGIPILHTPRDFYLLCPRTTMFRGGKPCVNLCSGCRQFSYPRRLMSRYVNGVTGISSAILDRHRRFGMFPNAVFLPPIVSAINAPAELPIQPTRVEDGPVRFGYIGRIAEQKGIDLLLDSLLSTDPALWTLSLAGRADPGYLKHLHQRCAGLPVRFLGYVPQAEFFRTVDVVVAPSIWEEPGPRTVLEALGYGLTVITSTRCGHAELLEHGRTAYIIDPDRPEEMVSVITSIVANPTKGRALGAAGRAFAMQRTDAAVAAEYERASRNVISVARR